mmetsp:Transcript_17388/g.39187  ORF Transcript_17388/g.39187 Transcript_17388/m.39187 type:complete len:278 (+) Transcript_17388:74-907(+)
MVKSLIGGLAATAAVYGASRTFVPGTMSSPGGVISHGALRGASPPSSGADMCSKAVIGLGAAACVVATVRGTKVARRVQSGGISEWGPVGLKKTDDDAPFASGLVGSEYGGFGGRYEWDPVGFSTRWPEHLAWYREAELKHGRVAMLAFAGLLAPDLFRLPWAEFQDSSIDFVNAHDKFVGGFGPMWWGFIACGGIEYQRFRKLGLGMEGLNLENAGNLGWFDLPKNSEERLFYEMAEIKNGRLAMLAVSGIFTAGVFWDQHHFPFIAFTDASRLPI